MLDWGCGNGHFSYALVALGYDVTGYTFEDFPLRARLPGRYRFVLGRGRARPSALPFPAAEFDAVFSVGVLEHVRETGGTRGGEPAEIARVLRPGGSFVCYHFPNRSSAIEAAASLLPAATTTPGAIRAATSARCARGRGSSWSRAERYGILPRNLLHRLPRRAARARTAVAAAWDGADRALELALSPIAQNHLFVARKPAEPGGPPQRRATEARRPTPRLRPGISTPRTSW